MLLERRDRRVDSVAHRRGMHDRFDAHEHVHRGLLAQPRLTDRIRKPEAGGSSPSFARCTAPSSADDPSRVVDFQAAVDLVGGQRRASVRPTGPPPTTRTVVSMMPPASARADHSTLPAKIASCSASVRPISCRLAIVARMYPGTLSPGRRASRTRTASARSRRTRSSSAAHARHRTSPCRRTSSGSSQSVAWTVDSPRDPRPGAQAGCVRRADPNPLTRPAKWGTIPPPWWISSLRSGWRSSTPENTIRAMNADRSYSHPNVHRDLATACSEG